MLELNNVLNTIIKHRGKVAHIHTSFSDFPEGIEAHFNFYNSLLLNENLPLSRAERELLALETSKANRCSYCISHHEVAFERHDLNGITQIRKILFKELAEMLSHSPWKASILENKFLENGVSSAEWQHAVMVVSYFNFANRCAFAMGIKIEEDFKISCN
ncbi:MAG: carboxymuconolactone decarboxylase family protein [Bacteriovoracaceae bacterium]|nr:carboxymuconolactone decarboxylase family protein [Bacteriovoracaceae bacterium]